MYNKNNSKYKLYLAGVITEGQYYEILEKIENVGYAYVGDKGVLIPSIHDGGYITPPDSENTRQHVKQILEKYGYWYEGKGENIGEDSGFGKGSELKYCKEELGVENPTNNGSYDDHVIMIGHWAGVPALTSIKDKWHGSVPIDAIGKNSQTMGDAIFNILAQGHGTFANKGVNIKLPESDIQKIFAVIQKDFPNWQNQPLGGQKETEVYEFLRKIEDHMFEVPPETTALSILGWEAEHDREKQIVKLAMANGGLFFLGKDHFTGPIIGKFMTSSPIASNQLVN